MARYKNEDIVGAIIGEEVISWDHLTEEEKESLRQEQILTDSQRDAADEEVWFCDRSGERL